MAAGDDNLEQRSGGGSSDEPEPEEKTDGWMTTYSDMVTLLMTFFVLMFAISNVDANKAALMFAAFSREGLTAEAYEKIAEIYGPPTDDLEADRIPPPQTSPTPTPHLPPEIEESNPQMDALAALLQSYIDEMGLGESIKLLYNGDYLLLTLANDIWFASGSAVVTPDMRETAAVLAQLISEAYNEDNPFEIVVAGHTDNVPINTAQYPSNWHVSVARAVNFMEILLFDSGLDSGQFSARGFGEERPLDTNDTPEGRQANRRVEVLITLAREIIIGPGAFGAESPDVNTSGADTAAGATGAPESAAP